ncbi:sorting assembly machinery 50 kDa subunit [Plasmodium brasilianum]|uniref:Sorting assembly machinery 50 kDa subunit, putative n=2 Tax=Plasmodium (Plasmodium) TaxID=418103 RepID=A0A1A8WUV0_PLAMA|nr:sorting assembly machinery 50 kDa subunit, putative [Plasmodium malariae]KAI4837407.1 sorting assembly machinery 50 kDa subunit [Plasmodium brasilianum]SBS96125.1 sorting assembly machinery 50 kDa subunit, putative (SAM50) [Plasmodium malariae]SCO93292.1 sorting assembly machinery 50 kDa subunit, putative [Plasmodium malariae]
MNTEIDLKQNIGSVKINVDGIRKIKKKNLNFLFDEIKKSSNIEDLFLNISKCNGKINTLSIFDGDPDVKLRSIVNRNITIDYILKEKKNNYMIGTNVNNRGEITVDFDMNIPYILKTINSIELKANINSLYTNNFAVRFLIPYIYFIKNGKLIFESNISSLNNTKCASYIVKTNSLKTFLLRDNHSFTWEVNFNKIYHKINKNFIPSNKILQLQDNHIKHTIKHNYKKDRLNYMINNGKEDKKFYYTLYPTSGYYYEIENEISLPFCESKFFKNHLNFLYVQKILQNFYSYINFSNGMKYDYNKDKCCYINKFNFTGSIGSSLIFRGFEHNSIGNAEKCFKFNKKKKNYDINYKYLGANFFTNIQFIFKYIFNFYNSKPILFFYVQLGKLSDTFFSSITQLKKDTRVSAGIGLMTYIQKNISLELFLSYPLLHTPTDKTKLFQVGLNFKGAL